jgi:hypothetical protein
MTFEQHGQQRLASDRHDVAASIILDISSKDLSGNDVTRHERGPEGFNI